VADADKRAETTDSEPATATSTHRDDERTDKPVADKSPEKKRRGTGKKVVAGANAVRSRIASVVWLVAVVCALFLAVGALLVALKANPDNAIVTFVLDAADKLDLGVFSRDNGIFTPKKDPNGVKSALINWGLGAVAYLVAGKVADRVIRP
jgi:hypothetical protein